jgi:TrmH family RNA methyltransferase
MNESKHPFISTARDSRFLTLHSLQTPQGRSRTGRYMIEGVRHLARAVEHNAPIESVFLDPSVLCNPFGRKLTRRLRKRGIPSIRLSWQLYRDITLAAEPQGIGVVLRQQRTSLQQLRRERNSLWLALESIESPGNFGTMIRTAEAASASGSQLWRPHQRDLWTTKLCTTDSPRFS